MPIRNALLIRWAGGYTMVVDEPSIAQWGKREDFVSLAHLENRIEARRQGQAILATMAQPAETIVIGVAPAGNDDEPYDDFDIGDRVEAPARDGTPALHRVEALSVSMDEQQNLTWTPELATPAQQRDEKVQRWLRRMAPGGMSGRSESATPFAARGVPRPDDVKMIELPPFSQPGPVVLALSGPYPAPYAMRAAKLSARLQAVSTSGPVEVDVLVAGSVVDSISIPAGEGHRFKAATFPIPLGASVQVETTAAGTGAAGLVLVVSVVVA